MSIIVRYMGLLLKPFVMVAVFTLFWASCIFDNPEDVPLYKKDTIQNVQAIAIDTVRLTPTDSSWLVYQIWDSIPKANAESLLFTDTLYTKRITKFEKRQQIQTQIIIRQEKSQDLFDTLSSSLRYDTVKSAISKQIDSTFSKTVANKTLVQKNTIVDDQLLPSITDTLFKEFRGLPNLIRVLAINDSTFEFYYMDTTHTWEIYRIASYKVQYREHTWTRPDILTSEPMPFFNYLDTLFFPDSSSITADTVKNLKSVAKKFTHSMRWAYLSTLTDPVLLDSLRPAIKISLADSQFIESTYPNKPSVSISASFNNAQLAPTNRVGGTWTLNASDSAIYMGNSEKFGHSKWWQCIYTKDGNIKIFPISIRQNYQNFYPEDSTLSNFWNTSQAKRLASDSESITLSTFLEGTPTALDSIARLRSKFTISGDFSFTLQFRHSQANGSSATSAIVVSSATSLNYLYDPIFTRDGYAIIGSRSGFLLYSQGTKSQVNLYGEDNQTTSTTNKIGRTGYLKMERKGNQIYLAHRSDLSTTWSTTIFPTDTAPVYLHFLLGDYGKDSINTSAQLELSNFKIEQGSIVWP